MFLGRTFHPEIVFHVDLEIVVCSVVVHQVSVTNILFQNPLVDMELYGGIDLSKKC
jgi:hypothetical protein